MPILQERIRTMSVADGCTKLVEAILERDAEGAKTARQALFTECALRDGGVSCYVGRRVSRKVLRYIRDNQITGDEREAILALLVEVRGRELSARKLAILSTPSGLAVH